MSTFQIPTEVNAYPEGTFPEIPAEAELTYEPQAGELIHVLLWERYPSYDFIFGVPAKTSPFYEKEVGFFQFRGTRAKVVRQGFYVDVLECLTMIDGFRKVRDVSKEHHRELWQEAESKGVLTI